MDSDDTRPPSPPTDEALMHAVAGGDVEAVGLLYDCHAPAVFPLCLRLTSGEAAAAEMLTAAFVALWRSAGQFDPQRDTVRAFLVAAVYRRAIGRRLS